MVPSAEDYVVDWEMRLEDATPGKAAEVAATWNSERALRGNIEWPDEAMPVRLKDTVRRRLEQLKQSDLATQRLNAEDA